MFKGAHRAHLPLGKLTPGQSAIAHILSSSLFTNHPTIWQYIVLATDIVVTWNVARVYGTPMDIGVICNGVTWGFYVSNSYCMSLEYSLCTTLTVVQQGYHIVSLWYEQ
jgi:hypothetical protein